MTSSSSSATSKYLLATGSLFSLRRFALCRKFLLALPCIGFIWQCLLASSSEDLICTALAASGSFLVLFFTFRRDLLYQIPLSSLLVLGFAVTLQLGPLLFTAIEGHSLTFNLEVPVATFGHAFLSSLLCVFAHTFYRRLRLLIHLRNSLQGLLFRLRLFQPLCATEVFVMGCLGVFALGITSWLEGIFGQPIIFTKLFQGFQFLSVVPFAYVLQSLYSKKARFRNAVSKDSLIFLILFAAPIVIVAIGRNSRSVALVPFAVLFIGLAIEWIFCLINIRLSAVLGVGLAILMVYPLVTDLATAIVMVRGERRTTPTVELLTLTFNQLRDRDAIKRYRDHIYSSAVGSPVAGSDARSNWSESYVNNNLLSRFSNAKYLDNSLHNSQQLTPVQRSEMAAFHWFRLSTIFPNFVLTSLGVKQDLKKEVNKYSFGDKLYYLYTGDSKVLGGFRQSHFFGSGMSAFSYGYLFIFLVGLLLTFAFVDSHVLPVSPGYLVPPLISVVAITQLYSWFTFANTESVVSFYAFLLRGFIQPVLLFALARWFVKLFRVS